MKGALSTPRHIPYLLHRDLVVQAAGLATDLYKQGERNLIQRLKYIYHCQCHYKYTCHSLTRGPRWLRERTHLTKWYIYPSGPLQVNHSPLWLAKNSCPYVSWMTMEQQRAWDGRGPLEAEGLQEV